MEESSCQWKVAIVEYSASTEVLATRPHVLVVAATVEATMSAVEEPMPGVGSCVMRRSVVARAVMMASMTVARIGAIRTKIGVAR